MDFQQLADSFFSPTCIVSVEKKENSGYGAIYLVTGNKKYLDMITIRLKDNSFYVSPEAGNSFIPNSLYTSYFPQNRSFEEICFHAAIRQTEMHTYAHLNNPDLWFDIYAMPLAYHCENVCYCIYIAKPNRTSDGILSTINTAQTSNDVLKTCIKLHRADNLKDAMECVISDIHQICKAEFAAAI